MPLVGRGSSATVGNDARPAAIEKAEAARAAMGAFRGHSRVRRGMEGALEVAPPGTRGRMLNAVLQLSTAADRRTYVDKSRWSDEDIDRELERLTQKIERDKARAWTGLEYVI